MPISKEGGRYRFQFNRVIERQRIRASKLLPKGWTQKQAHEYDQRETARLYAIASGQQEEPLIEDAVLLYCQEHCPTLKSGKEIERELAADFHLYAGKRMSELPDVAVIIRKDKQAEATKKKRISYLRAACRYAFKHHNMGDVDPSNRLSMPTVNNERQVYASRAEMLAIARHCKKLVRPYIRIAFYSGMRLGEILRAEIKDGRFVLHDTKNRSPRIIPIHAKIKTALRAFRTKPAKSTVQAYFREARASANLEHIRFHDLRHSAASEMINADIDLYVVGAVLGHKDPRSTKRYSHLKTKKLEDAINQIGRKVGGRGGI